MREELKDRLGNKKAAPRPPKVFAGQDSRSLGREINIRKITVDLNILRSEAIMLRRNRDGVRTARDTFKHIVSKQAGYDAANLI